MAGAALLSTLQAVTKGILGHIFLLLRLGVLTNERYVEELRFDADCSETFIHRGGWHYSPTESLYHHESDPKIVFLYMTAVINDLLVYVLVLPIALLGLR